MVKLIGFDLIAEYNNGIDTKAAEPLSCMHEDLLYNAISCQELSWLETIKQEMMEDSRLHNIIKQFNLGTHCVNKDAMFTGGSRNLLTCKVRHSILALYTIL